MVRPFPFSPSGGSAALFLSFAVAVLAPQPVEAADKTVVHHYYHGTQKQRQSTRFTILEWLKIKKRIKEMDVWLAMYSSPQKAKFRPELKLSYTLNRTAQTVDTAGAVAPVAHQQMNRRLKGQLFLTNLITSTLRAKLLNIDVGFEMTKDDSQPVAGTAKFFPRSSLAPGFSTEALYGYSATRQAVNVRLLGSHIQDSSLMIKYGTISEGATPVGAGDEQRRTGSYYELESMIYLTSWFAIHGLWQKDEARDDAAPLIHSQRRELGATIDIGLIGVTGGVFDYSRSRDFSGGAATVPNKGQFIGVAVNF